MGSHSKKHKKNRNRSRSRSLSSEHRHHKSRRRSRSRSVSRSSSDSYRSDRCSKVKKRRHRSRSRSRNHSRSRSPSDRYKRWRSRSRSKDRDCHSRHRRRSRSRSGSRSKRRSRTRSRTPSRGRVRNRSRSLSLERSSHSRSHSRHESKEKAKSKDTQEDKPQLIPTPAEMVKQKMQKALEAAASANDKLKEKGVLPTTIKQEPVSMAEEMEKQKTIAEIEEDSFKQSTFLSGQSTQARPLPATMSKEQHHDNAIFGSAAATVLDLNQTSFRRNQTIFYKTVNRGELASSLLAKTSEEKMDAWMVKLKRMRQEKIQANPEYFKKLLTIGAASDDAWSV